MDMYRILENFDAVNRKENLSEGLAGAALGGLAGAALTKSPGGAMSGANIGSAIQDKLGEGRKSKIKKLIDAYRELYPKIAYDANGDDLMEPEEAHDETSRQLGVDPGDMDEYLEDEELDEERRSEEEFEVTDTPPFETPVVAEWNKHHHDDEEELDEESFDEEFTVEVPVATIIPPAAVPAPAPRCWSTTSASADIGPRRDGSKKEIIRKAAP
jgi:hypothetical protein